MRIDDIPDEHLLYLVGQADKELFDAGRSIVERQLEVPQLLMERFGYIGNAVFGQNQPPILKRISHLYSTIYRRQDLAAGGHIGVFMYRDVFAGISVPHVYGKSSIRLFRYVELTPVQLRMIQTEPDQMSMYVDQFIDVADVQYGSQEIKSAYSGIEVTSRFIGLSRLHLHSASAVLTGGYDFRGAVQSSLLATELALKAGAATTGLSENKIKDKFGHNTDALANFLGSFWPSFDLARVKRVIAAQPSYVPNRYSAVQPDRREVGHLVMGAQYLVAEVVRQFSDRDFRAAFDPLPARTYPL